MHRNTGQVEALGRERTALARALQEGKHARKQVVKDNARGVRPSIALTLRRREGVGDKIGASAPAARTLARRTIASLLSKYVDRRQFSTCPPAAASHSVQPIWCDTELRQTTLHARTVERRATLWVSSVRGDTRVLKTEVRIDGCRSRAGGRDFQLESRLSTHTCMAREAMRGDSFLGRTFRFALAANGFA